MTTGYCDWHKVRYETPECAQCARETWKSQRVGGCMIVPFIWPFWLAGAIAGTICGAFWSAFKEMRPLWDDIWKHIRTPKPK